MKQNGKILDVSRTHDTCRRRKTAGQIDGRQKGGAGRRSCRGAGTPAPITYPLASGFALHSTQCRSGSKEAAHDVEVVLVSRVVSDFAVFG